MDGQVAEIERRFAGRLTVEAKLGQGGMGAVYRVRRDGEPCALKVLIKGALSDEAAMRRFLLEGRVLARLAHPNIIRVHELGEAADFPYILCELVEGESLDVVVAREGPLPWDRALTLTAQVLQGLAAAHAADVIHRDIKPSNVLVGQDGSVKLADFGIAKAEQLESKHTTTGIIVGTPAYIAPEVIRGARSTARSDVYSTGVLLFELLTGRLPWEATEAGPLLAERIKTVQVPLLPTACLPELPRSLDALVETALAAEPVQRYPSANLFRTAIENTQRQLMQAVGAPRATVNLGTPVPRRTTARLAARRPAGPGTAPLSVPAAPRSPMAAAVALLALLGLVTVAAIARRTAAPAVATVPLREAVSTAAIEGPPPTSAEAVLAGDLRRGTGNVLEGAIARVVQQGDARAAQLLYAAWNEASPERKRPLRDALAQRKHPLALPALVQVLQTKEAEAAARGSAARVMSALIDELEREGVVPEAIPQRQAMGNGLCDVLEKAMRDAEEKDVLAAAVRAVGFLKNAGTSRECLQAMVVAQSAGEVANALVRSALGRFDENPARDLARKELAEMLPGTR